MRPCGKPARPDQRRFVADFVVRRQAVLFGMRPYLFESFRYGDILVIGFFPDVRQPDRKFVVAVTLAKIGLPIGIRMAFALIADTGKVAFVGLVGNVVDDLSCMVKNRADTDRQTDDECRLCHNRTECREATCRFCRWFRSGTIQARSRKAGGYDKARRSWKTPVR